MVANDSPRDEAPNALSAEDRKRFFRPPVAGPGAADPSAETSGAPAPEPPVTRPVQVSGLSADAQADLVLDEPRPRKSFDEILAGEIHRMTDAIPIIGRNRNGEPRRVIVVFGIVVGIAAVVGVVVAAVFAAMLGPS